MALFLNKHNIIYPKTSEVPMKKGKPTDTWMQEYTLDERKSKFFEFCEKFDQRKDDLLRDDFQIFSHTCNPETDSVPVLKRYADSLKVDTKKWVFLTGRKDSLYQMARGSYLLDDPKNNLEKIEDQFIHTQFFALVDRNGKIRGKIYDGLKALEVQQLKTDVGRLLKDK